MNVETAVAAIAAFAICALLTGAVRRYALSRGVLDVPNRRSSHDVPTPRAGGVAVIVAATAAFAALAAIGTLRWELCLALISGGVAVGVVGFLDDRFRVSAIARITVHVLAAAWALWLLGGLPPLRFANEIVDLAWIGHLLATAGIVWALNLFNFMDGIDGIAASEATFVTGAGAALMTMAGVSDGVPEASLVVAGASCGFLVWNWPPAKIFMGDVGSGYLGYVIAVFAVAATREHPAALFVWLILGAAFFVDALVTLVRRLARRERVYEAHRMHAYQWLSRRWASHRRATLTFLAINLGWLLPLAWYANRRPDLSTWIAVAALFPLVALAIAAGSGRPESPASGTGENQSSSR